MSKHFPSVLRIFAKKFHFHSHSQQQYHFLQLVYFVHLAHKKKQLPITFLYLQQQTILKTINPA